MVREIKEFDNYDSLQNVRFDDLNDFVDKLNELIRDYNKKVGSENGTW